MKPYALALLAIIALTSLGIFLVARSSVTPKSGPVIVAPAPKFAPPTVPTLAPPDPIKEAARREALAARAPEAQASVTETTPPPDFSAPAVAAPGAGVEPSNDPLAAEKAIIQNLVAAHNPANVPAIARYLEHENAELRQEAVLGLLTLGEKGGAPFLIAATVKARTPEEAEAFKEAADFLNKGVKDTSLPPPPPEPTNEASPADLAP